LDGQRKQLLARRRPSVIRGAVFLKFSDDLVLGSARLVSAHAGDLDHGDLPRSSA
jgi:hypothetical protein